MKKRLKCATLLALSGAVLTGGSSVGAAPTSSCDPGDKLVSAITSPTTLDGNGNGLICEHAERYHGTKKKGPGGTTYTYYDDTLRKK